MNCTCCLKTISLSDENCKFCTWPCDQTFTQAEPYPYFGGNYILVNLDEDDEDDEYEDWLIVKKPS